MSQQERNRKYENRTCKLIKQTNKIQIYKIQNNLNFPNSKRRQTPRKHRFEFMASISNTPIKRC